MLSPQLRRKVFSLWTMFWSGGIANPLTAIEQITYLLFLKHLENLDKERERQKKTSIYAGSEDYQKCRWSYIRQDPTHELFSQTIFPWLRTLDESLLRLNDEEGKETRKPERIMEDAYFQLPPEKTNMLQEAVQIVDELFIFDSHSDLMGEIFEYLLSEITSAGKNGQFRTPRHIIRFMVELVDPQPGDRIIDPAAGTSGFLFSSIQHLRQAVTPEDVLRLEWDGTPHRLGGPEEEEIIKKTIFTGYDNDRTMVRIGWMNMILHGIEDPRIMRRDSLGKNLGIKESESYDVVLANPPFTGNVDTGDLHERFLQGGRKNKPLTNKSELLFLMLFLDLLTIGGRAAVIVPEGVLFGSTTAHRELRRRLLFEHDLRAVISLPAGVFQPYTGVKTSILFFRKHRRNEDPAFKPGDAPITQTVFFYEILEDGYSLDARRNENPEKNDLPDAITKVGQRSVNATEYFKPRIHQERWRLVDEDTQTIFFELVDEKEKIYGIHELFRQDFERFETLEGDPDLEQIASYIVTTQSPKVLAVLENATLAALAQARESAHAVTKTKARDVAEKKLREAFNQARKAFSDAAGKSGKLLDNEDEKHGRRAFEPVLQNACEIIEKKLEAWIEYALGEAEIEKVEVPNLEEDAKSIIREFAKLDGYTIRLRDVKAVAVTPEAHPYANLHDEDDPLFKTQPYTFEARSWLAPVRVFVRNDEWTAPEKNLQGSHDENGNVRLEYINWLVSEGKFNDDGTLNDLSVLQPDCIEANDLNLSAGRYKPFLQTTTQYPPPAEIIAALEQHEHSILSGLARLKVMVEGEE